MGAGEQADPFLLGGERNGMDRRVREGEVDEHPVARVRDVGELRYVELPQDAVDIFRPGRIRLRLAPPRVRVRAHSLPQLRSSGCFVRLPFLPLRTSPVAMVRPVLFRGGVPFASPASS